MATSYMKSDRYCRIKAGPVESCAGFALSQPGAGQQAPGESRAVPRLFSQPFAVQGVTRCREPPGEALWPGSSAHARGCSTDALTEKDGPKKSGSEFRPSRTAKELPGQLRDISVSEFFSKNRHLLRFDSAKRALLTMVKEAADNSLDAREEAGMLPEVAIELEGQ